MRCVTATNFSRKTVYVITTAGVVEPIREGFLVSRGFNYILEAGVLHVAKNLSFIEQNISSASNLVKRQFRAYEMLSFFVQ